jgi:hypothetical protein
MVRHNAAVWIALAAMLLVSVACADARPEDPPGKVTGLIVELQRDEGRIASFILETSDDRRYEVAIDPERDYGFELEHLEEHRLQQLPVEVRIDEREGALYATEILDA